MDSNLNNLIGTWQSFKVDSLINYFIPSKENTSNTRNFNDNILVINNDGTFKLVELKDTIYGNWIFYKNDSIKIIYKHKNQAYLYESKLEFLKKNYVTLSYSYGSVSDNFDESGRMIENAHTIFNIKTYYKRK